MNIIVKDNGMFLIFVLHYVFINSGYLGYSLISKNFLIVIRTFKILHFALINVAVCQFHKCIKNLFFSRLPNFFLSLLLPLFFFLLKFYFLHLLVSVWIYWFTLDYHKFRSLFLNIIKNRRVKMILINCWNYESHQVSYLILKSKTSQTHSFYSRH